MTDALPGEAMHERIAAALSRAEAAAVRLRAARDTATARAATVASAGDRAVAALDALLADPLLTTPLPDNA